MSCDIHARIEKKVGDKWLNIPTGAILDMRAYGIFGFLADVRNYSAVPPIAAARGVPPDISKEVRADIDHWECDGHTHSWLSMSELMSFDYDQPVEDRRVTINGDGGRTAPPGKGRMTTYRKFLGEWFFQELATLNALGAQRIVFWFDC